VIRDANHIYTAHEIGEFLGWIRPTGQHHRKVDTCLTALQYIEEGLLKLSIFEKLNTAQMVAVIDETRNARKHLEQVAQADEQAAAQARQESVSAGSPRQNSEKWHQLGSRGTLALYAWD
jgi:hypothetical protein